MPKTKRAPSKRMPSSQRHKIERKKREHKRDLRRAAKAMKASGLGPKRTKKSREMAKLALKMSNANPDKEEFLKKILQGRENVRVMRATKKAEERERALRGDDAEESHNEPQPQVDQPKPTADASARSLLFIPHAKSNDFQFQFNKALEYLVYPLPPLPHEDGGGIRLNAELPVVVFVVTVDARCAVPCIPWTLLDAIVARGDEYQTAHEVKKQKAGKKRSRDETQPTLAKAVLIHFALTKVDLVSAQTIGTQFALLSDALYKRYFASDGASPSAADCEFTLRGGISFSFSPFSTQFDRTAKHMIRVVRQFSQKVAPTASHGSTTMNGKAACFVIGLSNTGRRSLSRHLLAVGTESVVSIVPLRSAQIKLSRAARSSGSETPKDHEQIDEEVDDVQARFSLPCAKPVTLIQFAEDSRWRRAAGENITGGDVIFQSFSYVEKLPEPEVIAMAIVESATDKVGLAQAFCQPMIDGALQFLRGIGKTIVREKGFHVSPLFVANAGTAGRLGASSLTASTGFCSGSQSANLTLLDATLSNATPSKLVRVSALIGAKGGKRPHVTAKRDDQHSALRLGARTFIREFTQSRHVPWAILRSADGALTPEGVARSSQIFQKEFLPPANHSESCEGALSPQKHLEYAMDGFSNLLKDSLALLPNAVVEFSPDCVAPTLHSVDEGGSETDESDTGSQDEGESPDSQSEDGG